MTTTTRNVTIPTEYFRRALKDYSDWHFAMIREFAQNAADAGATSIAFTATHSLIECRDNGAGCSATTIENKLLVLGGSEKPDGAVGGFGLAKELLYFAHPEWTIRTRDVLVKGAYGTYTMQAGLEHHEGFHATVKLAEASDVSNLRYAVRRFTPVFDRPDCVVTLNGSECPTLDCYRKAGRRAAKVFSWGKAYRVKDGPSSNNVWLRTSGIPSTYEWVSNLSSDVGTVFVEITGASSEVLSVSRERFRSETARAELAGWLSQLVTDSRKALDDHDVDDDPVALFFDVDDAAALLASAPEDKPASEMTAADLDALEAELLAPVATALGKVNTSGGTSGAAFVAVGNVDLAALVRDGKAPTKGALARTPPALSKADLPDVGAVKVGVRVAPNGVKAARKYLSKWFAKRDLAGWATACEAVFRAMGRKLDTVGFTFDANVNAEAVIAGDRFALFVNPAALETATSKFVAEELIDLAIHEAAHILAPGGHTEGWAQEEMRIRRALRGTDIAKLVRTAVRSVQVERPAT